MISMAHLDGVSCLPKTSFAVHSIVPQLKVAIIST